MTTAIRMDETVPRTGPDAMGVERLIDEIAAAQSRAIRGISNELRPLLQRILASAEDLAVQPRTITPEQRRGLSSIESTVRSGMVLLRQLDELWSGEDGRIALRNELVDISALARRAAERAAPALDRAGHRLVIDAPGEGSSVWTDPWRVRQVLDALLAIAGRRAPRGATITVRADVCDGPADDPRPGSWLALSVTAGAATVSEKRRGLARRGRQRAELRLEMAVRIARALGGALDVSTPPGADATYTLRLPLGVRAPEGEAVAGALRSRTETPLG
jgi:signal transduction histidine kinase